MASRYRDKLLKAIGLSQKLFTRAQYDAAKRRLREREGKGSIGDALVAMGAMTADQHRGLERAIDYRIGRDEDKEITRVIVDSGYASQYAIDEALRHQKEFYAKTGQLLRVADLLVERGALTSEQHRAALKIFELEKGPVPPEASSQSSGPPPAFTDSGPD